MMKIKIRASKEKLIPCAVVAAIFMIFVLHAPIVPVVAGCALTVLLLLLSSRNAKSEPGSAARN